MNKKPEKVKIIPTKKVCEILGNCSRQHLYNLEKAGLIPQHVQISENRIGWVEDEILEHAWKKIRQRNRRRLRL
jgi:predicted DNA-binding transcriptional regulator AlpA